MSPSDKSSSLEVVVLIFATHCRCCISEIFVCEVHNSLSVCEALFKRRKHIPVKLFLTFKHFLGSLNYKIKRTSKKISGYIIISRQAWLDYF